MTFIRARYGGIQLNPSTLEAELCEASLVYRWCSGIARATLRNLASKNLDIYVVCIFRVRAYYRTCGGQRATVHMEWRLTHLVGGGFSQSHLAGPSSSLHPQILRVNQS